MSVPSAVSPVRAALREPGIRRTAAGFGLLTLGEWILGTAVAIALFASSGPLAVGLVGARFVPAALASVLLAGLVDHVAPARALAGVAALRALAAAACAVVLAHDGATAFVIALVWLDAAAGSAYRPAQSRLLPSLARTPGELTGAVALASNAKSAGQIAGALAGGLVLARAGAPTAVACAASASLLSAVLALRSRRAPAPAGDRSAEGIGRGLALIAGHRETRVVAAWAGARSLLRGVWMALGVIAAATSLDLGEGGFGILMTAAGIGTVVGIGCSGVLAGRRVLGAPFAASLVLCAVPLAVVAAVPATAVALAAMVIWGIGMAVSDVTAQALLARVVPPVQTPRVVGAMEGGKLLAEGLGALLAPVAYELAGLDAALIGSAALVLVLLAADLPGFRAVDRRALGRTERLELVRGVPLFGALRLDGLEMVAAALVPGRIRAGEDLFVQDTTGSRWYLIEDGVLEVRVDGFLTGTLRRGAAVGERSLLRAEPRAATVRAATDSAVLGLERGAFLRAVTGTADAPVADVPAIPRDVRAMLRRQHVLAHVSDGALAELERVATRWTAAAGTLLFGQDAEDDRYLLLLDGEVQVVVDGVPRRTLRPGDALGEIAVLHRRPRTASARAVRDTDLLVIDGASLREAVTTV